MSDEEIFEKWWKVYSPPGTFDKAQCKVAFIAGMIIQRVEAAQQTFAPDVCHRTADGRHLWQNDSNGRYCFACGTRR